MGPTRRLFVSSSAAIMAAIAAGADRARAAASPAGADRFGCNTYSWRTFFAREGKKWWDNPDASLAEFAQSGLKDIQPTIAGPEELEVYAPLLKKHGVRMTSVYIDTTLHDPAASEASMATAAAIAAAAKAKAGTTMIVTNPRPLPQGADKTDAQLTLQARNLDRLGARLRDIGVVFALHNHSPEMRQSARELHHNLLATDPKNLKYCLDVHWVWRGAGNSQVALFDIIKLYGPRVAEVHIRQSTNGIYSELFGPGDIDYVRVAAELAKLNVKPHLVLEQGLEQGSTKDLPTVEAHRQSLRAAAEVFAKV